MSMGNSRRDETRGPRILRWEKRALYLFVPALKCRALELGMPFRVLLQCQALIYQALCGATCILRNRTSRS